LQIKIKEINMENLEFKDAQKAKTARELVATIAGQIVASYDTMDDATVEASLDLAVKIFRGASARVKVEKEQPAAVAVASGGGQ
jgi:hypothetical protein